MLDPHLLRPLQCDRLKITLKTIDVYIVVVTKDSEDILFKFVDMQKGLFLIIHEAIYRIAINLKKNIACPCVFKCLIHYDDKKNKEKGANINKGIAIFRFNQKSFSSKINWPKCKIPSEFLKESNTFPSKVSIATISNL